MSNCEILKQIQNKIATGTPAEEAIPYSIKCSNESDYLELLYYASQVLPDGSRKEACKKKMEELKNASRTDQRGQ